MGQAGIVIAGAQGTHARGVRRARNKKATTAQETHRRRRDIRPRMMAIITVCAVSSGDEGTVCAAADWNKAHAMEQTSTKAGTEGTRRVAVKDCCTFCMEAIA